MLYEFREQIPLTTDEIYDFMRSPQDWARLYGAFGTVEDRGDGWYAVPMKRSPFPLVARITENEPGRRVAWRFRGVWRGHGEVNLEPLTDGTLVTGFESISIPRLLGLGPVIERRILERQLRAVWESGWRRLRRMAKAGAGPNNG